MPPTRYTPGASTILGSFGVAGTFGAERISYQGLRIVWHYRASNEDRTFTVHYRLAGVVRRHPDVVDIQQQVWGDQWKQGLGSLSVRLILPGRTPTGGCRQPVRGLRVFRPAGRHGGGA